jgi:glutamyl-tRNA reductase
MVLVSGLVTHRWARVRDLEAFAKIPAEEYLKRALGLPSVTEAIVLRTCNRVELHLASNDPAQARAAATEMLHDLAPSANAGKLVRWKEGDAAAEHVLRVAAGLESMVVGEAQILGQTKEALDLGLAQGTAGRELTLLFHKAIATGKRVQTETDLGKGAVSMGSAAVKLARRTLRSLDGKRVVLVGTGDMAALVAKALRGEGCRVTVASRHEARAKAIAAKVQGQAASYADLPRLAGDADVLVYATAAPRVLLDAAKLRSWRQGSRALVVLDVANPRNVHASVGRMRHVTLLNIDSLRALSRENLRGRKAAAARAEGIVAEELDAWRTKRSELLAEDVLRALYEQMREVRASEVERALARLRGSSEERDIVEALANSVVNKLLAKPTLALKAMAREQDPEAVRIAARLFGVDHGSDPETPKASPK